MMKRHLFCLAFSAVMLAAPTIATAAETGGCESFTWPLATELKWMKDGDSAAVASGGKLTELPQKAIALSLQPMDKVMFPMAPTSRKKNGAGARYGGFVDFEGVAAGSYQVTIANVGWIDVVQGGKALKPSAHTGKSDCDGIRKSVRFDIGASPFTVELSDVPKDAIKFAIRPAQ